MAGLVTRRYLRHRFGSLRAVAQAKPVRRLRRADAGDRATGRRDRRRLQGVSRPTGPSGET
jgi:hypothetical protein